MAKKPLPSPEELRQLLRYEPETGKLFWLPRPREMFTSDRSFNTWNVRFAGAEAFATVHRQGYRCGVIAGEKCLAHRAVWAVHSGRWPENQIDHINGDKTDNRIANLREATHAENLQNSRRPSRNTSGFKGVCFDRSRGKWMARIHADGRDRMLGRFDTPEEAHAAYRAAAEKHHGEFARTE